MSPSLKGVDILVIIYTSGSAHSGTDAGRAGSSIGHLSNTFSVRNGATMIDCLLPREVIWAVERDHNTRVTVVQLICTHPAEPTWVDSAPCGQNNSVESLHREARIALLPERPRV
jgi:hypothetical protein